MRKMLIPLITVLCISFVSAEDLSEKGVHKSPLTIYSGGLTAGSVVSLNPVLRSISKQFLKVSFSNLFYIRDRIDLFVDADWFGPEANFGADVGCDFYLTKFQVRPFYGLGVGALYFNRLNDKIGPSATVHIGLALDVTEKVQVRFRVPYHVVANKSRDQAIGLDVGFLFSNGYKRVKKLQYNQ